MKTIKLYDAWLQSIMIAAFVITAVFNHSSFLYGYIIVGTYQVMNTFIHVCFQHTSVYRTFYNWVLIVLAIVLGIAAIIPQILYLFAFVMLYISPFIAVAYNAICFYEVKKMQERPLALLK